MQSHLAHWKRPSTGHLCVLKMATKFLPHRRRVRPTLLSISPAAWTHWTKNWNGSLQQLRGLLPSPDALLPVSPSRREGHNGPLPARPACPFRYGVTRAGALRYDRRGGDVALGRPIRVRTTERRAKRGTGAYAQCRGAAPGTREWRSRSRGDASCGSSSPKLMGDPHARPYPCGSRVVSRRAPPPCPSRTKP